MAEHTFVGAHAHPYARLKRALDLSSLPQAEAAARELAVVSVEDSLRLLLLYLDRRDERFERAAVRWLGRLLVERPTLGLARAGEAADALAGLDGAGPDVARSRLALILRLADLEEAARVLERGR